MTTPPAAAPTTDSLKPPLALIVKDRVPVEVVAYACGECGVVTITEDAARSHCGPRRCSDCPAPLPSGRFGRCDPCDRKHRAQLDAQEAAKELDRYTKAKKLPYADYQGAMIYWPGADAGSDGEGYFTDVSDLLDHCALDSQNPPSWVWACSPVRLKFDAAELISRACEDQEMHEEASLDVPRSAEKQLQAFLDDWAEKNSPTSYFPDYSLALDISAEVLADIRCPETDEAPDATECSARGYGTCNSCSIPTKLAQLEQPRPPQGSAAP